MVRDDEISSDTMKLEENSTRYVHYANAETQHSIRTHIQIDRPQYDYSMPVTYKKPKKKETKIKVVVQRVNKASLLMNNEKEWSEMKRGLIFYVSFTKVCTKKDCERVAKNLMYLPVLTLGQWGDGSECKSVLQLCKEFERAPLEIMVIPQAGLTSRFASKRLQYHGQMPKSEGKAMYEFMCEMMKQKLNELIYPELNKKKNLNSNSVKADETIPPSELFKRPPLDAMYSVLDMQGVPTHDERGVELTKSKRKKLMKMMKAQEKRHAKYLKRRDDEEENGCVMKPMNKKKTGKEQLAIEMPIMTKTKDDGLKKIPRFIFGTFGNRQALKFESDMGPFTHTFDF